MLNEISIDTNYVHCIKNFAINDVQSQILLKIQKDRKVPLKKINFESNDNIDKIKNLVSEAFNLIH